MRWETSVENWEISSSPFPESERERCGANSWLDYPAGTVARLQAVAATPPLTSAALSAVSHPPAFPGSWSGPCRVTPPPVGSRQGHQPRNLERLAEYKRRLLRWAKCRSAHVLSGFFFSPPCRSQWRKSWCLQENGCKINGACSTPPVLQFISRKSLLVRLKSTSCSINTMLNGLMCAVS